jgi:hypothetical protein
MAAAAVESEWWGSGESESDGERWCRADGGAGVATPALG